MGLVAGVFAEDNGVFAYRTADLEMIAARGDIDMPRKDDIALLCLLDRHGTLPIHTLGQ